MEIPSQIKIGGLVFDVKESTLGYTDKDEDWGAFSLNKLTIWISSELTQEQKETALIHEIIEAINEMFDLELDHTKICIIENTLYQVLKDNKLI